MAMVRPYQLGDVVLHFHGDIPDHKLSDSGKSLELGFSPRLARPNTQYMPKPRMVKLDGIILSNCSETYYETVNRLNLLVGLETDLIGYVLWSHCIDNGCCSCCACSAPGKTCEVLWFHNRGTLKNVSLKGRDSNEVSIDIEMNAYWKTINNAIWEFVPFRNYRTLETLTFNASNFATPLPDCATIFGACDGCWQWVKRIYDTVVPLYDPTIYQTLLDELRPGYPKAYRVHDWDSGSKIDTIWIDKGIWNAPPLSVYEFRGIDDMSTIEFEVTRTNAVWTNQVSTVLINISGLNTRLVALGLSPIGAGDRIVVGDVRPLPGLVIRANGTIVDNVLIPITYGGFWPGFLEPGENRIRFGVGQSFSGYGVGDQAFSHYHIYRRF